MKILFVTRSLQVAPGGMQTYARTLIKALRDEGVQIDVCGYGGPKIFLPVFFLWACVRCVCFRGTHVHIGDAVLSPLLWPLSIVRPSLKRSVTVYGLDLTFGGFMYQSVIRSSLLSASCVVAISRATALEGEKIGIERSVIVVIPCGIDVPPLEKRSTSGHVQLLLFGRQIRRKGTRWFLQQVASRLISDMPDVTIIIAGDGSELPAIRDDVTRLGLEKNISTVGIVSNEEKQQLFLGSTLFVMPNRAVAGDMEGFGLVCIEAAATGLPVVAARIDGIPDAVIDGTTGLLFLSGDAEECFHTIKKALSIFWPREAIHEACRQHFSVKKMVSGYLTHVFR